MAGHPGWRSAGGLLQRQLLSSGLRDNTRSPREGASGKALENFAEYGGWHEGRVTYDPTRLVQTAPGRSWHGYIASAVDDTKVHRSSPNVWGTCTFHEYTARCPNRAGTVRAHNWVVLGALLHEPAKPGWFLPISGRLCFRRSQLPAGPGGPPAFRTTCGLAVELLRETARIAPGHKHLGVFDGGYALRSVVRPLVLPEGGGQRIDFLTRLRHDARLFALPPTDRLAGTRGPLLRWGRRLEPPRRGGRWERGWRTGVAFIYGRQRKVRWTEVVCPSCGLSSQKSFLTSAGSCGSGPLAAIRTAATDPHSCLRS